MIEPGIYTDLSNKDYADAKEYLSASGLKRFLPEYFKPPSGARDALDFGVAVHTKILGVGDTIRPVTAASWVGKAAKEERETAYQSGHVPVLEKDIPVIDAMADSVKAHETATTLLYGAGGGSEVSVFAEVDSVPCRARIDRVTGDGILVDLKSTTIRPDPHQIIRSVIDYGYDIQADHFNRVAAAAGMDPQGFVLVFVSKESPHFVTVVELDETFYQRAEALRDLALNRYLHPTMCDPYPGASGTLSLSVPRWARL